MKPTENNKLIAEFMGIESDNAKMRGHLYECPVTAEYITNLEYHYSWDWLLPVIREVLTLIDINKLDFDTTALKYEVLDNDIKQAYKEVLKFIKEYYNQN